MPRRLLDRLFGEPSHAPPAAPRAAAEIGPSTREVLDALPEPLLVVRERRVLLANRAARDVLGGHIEDADVRLALRHPAAAERLARPQAEGDGPVELAGLGDPERRWEMTTEPLAAGALLVRLSDRSAAYAAERMRVDFVANASHELRTPLATLIGFVETLEDDRAAEDRDTRRRFLSIMREEAKRMQQLVGDLMSLSRIEADRFATPREPVDLAEVVEEAAAHVGPLLERHGVRLEVEAEEKPALVPGDRPQLCQLVVNLVENSVKYGRSGEPVTVRVEAGEGGTVRLTVRDRGEGIAPEHIPHLTQRFYRVDPGRSRAQGGTGLGLAIVKHIVGRHRGRLEIKSRPGEGTDVSVWLPRAEPALS